MPRRSGHSMAKHSGSGNHKPMHSAKKRSQKQPRKGRVPRFPFKPWEVKYVSSFRELGAQERTAPAGSEAAATPEHSRIEAA